MNLQYVPVIRVRVYRQNAWLESDKSEFESRKAQFLLLQIYRLRFEEKCMFDKNNLSQRVFEFIV